MKDFADFFDILPSYLILLSFLNVFVQEIGDYSANISKRHAAFERFRDGTIKKWNEKTRLASGKVNSKVNSCEKS